jgi:hypothetical protein
MGTIVRTTDDGHAALAALAALAEENDDAAFARAWIEQRWQQAPATVLETASVVCSNRHCPLSSRRIASLAISCTFMPRRPSLRGQVRAFWAARPDVRWAVHDSLFVSLQSDDTCLQDRLARSLALVVGFRRGLMAPVLSRVWDLLRPARACCLLRVFHEILTLANFLQLLTLARAQIVLLLAGFALEVFETDGDVEPRRLAASCLAHSIEAGAPVDYHPALRSASISINQSHAQLAELCYMILLELVRARHATAPGFMPIVWDLVATGIATPEPDPGLRRWAALACCKQIGKLQRKRGGDLVGDVLELFLPVFLDAMLRISTDDVGTEGLDVKVSWNEAAAALSGFYRLAPAEVLSGFIEPNFPANIESENWTAQHAALSLLWAISRGERFTGAYKFVEASLPHVLRCCQNVTLPRVRERAFFVLAVVLKSFPRVHFLGGPDKFLEKIVAISSPHPKIRRRWGSRFAQRTVGVQLEVWYDLPSSAFRTVHFSQEKVAVFDFECLS